MCPLVRDLATRLPQRELRLSVSAVYPWQAAANQFLHDAHVIWTRDRAPRCHGKQSAAVDGGHVTPEVIVLIWDLKASIWQRALFLAIISILFQLYFMGSKSFLRAANAPRAPRVWRSTRNALSWKNFNSRAEKRPTSFAFLFLLSNGMDWEFLLWGWGQSSQVLGTSSHGGDLNKKQQPGGKLVPKVPNKRRKWSNVMTCGRLWLF